MEKAKSILLKLLPYIIILIATLCCNYLYFYNGLNIGDDYKFHLANIYEQYELLKSGKPIGEISPYIGIGLGSGTRLFYSPIPHFLIAFIAYLFNISIISSYKMVMITLVFISGVFMFRFAYAFTKSNKIIALICALCFVLFPYRSFDAFHRFAVAEAFAICFLPLFFMGLYHIVSFKDKINVLSFIEVIIGGALLYLTHNITAVFAFIAGIIYLLFNIKSIIKLMRNYKYTIYCFVSVVILVGLISVTMFTQLQLMSTNLYNVTNRVVMWTDIDSVINRSGEQFTYSGFLNVFSLVYNYPEIFNYSKLLFGVAIFILSCVSFVIIDGILKEKIKMKYIHLTISIPIYILLISIIDRRIEMYLGALIFLISYLIVTFVKDNKEEKVKNIVKDINVYYVITMLILCMCFMEFGGLWKLVPEMLLNIQFPWRLWALFQLFTSMFIGLIMYYINYKKVSKIIMCILIALFMVCNQAVIDNRASYDLKHDNNWINEVNETYLDSSIAMGFNKEYLPQIYFDDSYKSLYKNSLYNKVKYKIFYDTSKIEDYYYKPVVLKGNSDIEVIDSFADKHTINIDVNKSSLIQMPIFYYEGYNIKVTDINTNETYEVKPINIDGFVSFNLESGTYEVQTSYEGTTLRKVAKVYCVVSSSLVFVGLIYGIYEFIKRKKDSSLQKDS